MCKAVIAQVLGLRKKKKKNEREKPPRDREQEREVGPRGPGQEPSEFAQEPPPARGLLTGR